MMHRGLETPAAMAGRPVDPRGFPVPWFVTRTDADGAPDFTVIDAARWDEAARRRVCWVSGQPFGRHKVFVIGPMCIINRISADPPVRLDVARWSARICPFLSRPGAQRDRRHRDLVDEQGVMQGERGIALARNPGVCAVYSTPDVRQVPRERLLRLGEPTLVEWYAEGREATPEEVWSAVRSGFPSLSKMAEEEGDEAMIELSRMMVAATRWMPPPPEVWQGWPA